MEEIDNFIDALQPFLPTWKTVEVRAIADLDSGLLLSMVACFSPDDPTPSEVMDSIQGITFIREALVLSNFYDFLEEWDQGAIVLAENRLQVPEGFSDLRFTRLSTPHGDFVNGWPDFRTYRQFSLHCYGRQALDVLIGPKNPSAIAQIQGFNDFSEFSLDRVQFPVGGGQSTRIEIFAPILAGFEVEPEAQLIRLRVRVHEALSPDDLVLSYRVQDMRGNRLTGGTIPIQELQKSSSGYFISLEGSIEIPEGGTSGELNLFHKLYQSQQEPIATNRFTAIPSVGTRNPRWGLVSSIIDNTRAWTKQGFQAEEIIRQWLGLGSRRPQQDDFEHGVAVLLFVAGFSAVSIGQAEGVDQIAFVKEPDQTAIIISCTTSPNLQPKIATLAMQCNRAKDGLQGVSVLPAIFAPVDRRDLTVGDLEDCQSQNMTVVLRQDLESLLHGAIGVSWNQAADNFIQRVFSSRM